MSVFTRLSHVERLEEEMAELKKENESLKQRVVALTALLGTNRKTNKELFDEKESQYKSLRRKLQKMRDERQKENDNYWAMRRDLNDIIDARESEIAELKEETDRLLKTWAMEKSYTDDVIHRRNIELLYLKKELLDRNA